MHWTLILLMSFASLMLPARGSSADDLETSEIVRCPALTDDLMFVGMEHVATHDDLNEDLLGSTIADGIRRLTLQLNYDRVQEHLKSGAPLAQTIASFANSSEECISIDFVQTGLYSRWHSFDKAMIDAETIVLGRVGEAVPGFHRSVPGNKISIAVQEVIKGNEDRPHIFFFSPGADFSLWGIPFCTTINGPKILPEKGSQVLLFYMADRISASCPLLSEPRSMLITLEEKARGHRTSASGPGRDINTLRGEEIINQVKSLKN